MLEFSFRHASSDKIAGRGGCPWGLLGLGESRPGLVGLYVFLPFTSLVSWLRADFFFFFFTCCLLVEWREVRKRLRPVSRVASEGLLGGCLLQVALSPLYLWRS